jgi:hypothetical protein
MRNMKRILLVLTILISLFLVGKELLAHQPRIVSDERVMQIENPEISQAFYGELKGEPVYYQIEEDNNFSLYVGVLSPQIENADKDFSVEVIKNEKTIFVLDGTSKEWESFYEQFGGDYYYEGPDNKILAESGIYKLKVFSPDNQGKYVLVVGEKEEFPLEEIINTVRTLPKLKGDFFEKSPLSAFFNMIGLFIFGPIILISIIISVFLYKRKRNRK